MVDGQLDAPERSVKNSLANCCRSQPEILVRYLEQAQGPVRELLARVLSELASPELGEELLVLAADTLPEVRASAARALGNTNTSYTLPALHSLAIDPEWFVRLRAVVALGEIENVGKIRILLRSLCDANRHVRQRAAWVLARMEPQLAQILEDVVATHDDYALQSFISELERSGAIEKIAGLIAGSGDGSVQTTLREVVERAKKSVELSGKAVAAAAGTH
jgi:HEAT repeat protein